MVQLRLCRRGRTAERGSRPFGFYTMGGRSECRTERLALLPRTHTYLALMRLFHTACLLLTAWAQVRGSMLTRACFGDLHDAGCCAINRGRSVARLHAYRDMMMMGRAA